MIEKFSETLGKDFLNKEGKFLFTITDYELKEGPKGPMAVFEVESNEGKTTLYHSLNTKAKWSYANLTKVCFNLDTKEKIVAFGPHDGGIDYELIGQMLIGKQFVGVVQCQTYQKEIKKPNEDGTFSNDVEIKESFKIVEYQFVSQLDEE